MHIEFTEPYTTKSKWQGIPAMNEIEALYVAFQKYPKPKSMESCPHCGQKSDGLLVRALRDLQPEDLSEYAHRAISTWGSVADFKYFLPRLMECASEEGAITAACFSFFATARLIWWPRRSMISRGATRIFSNCKLANSELKR